jgi:hypothetical protein
LLGSLTNLWIVKNGRPKKVVPDTRRILDEILKHREKISEYFRMRSDAEDVNSSLQIIVDTFNRAVDSKKLSIKPWELVYFYKIATQTVGTDSDLAKIIVKSVCEEYEDIANEESSVPGAKSFPDALKDDGVVSREVGKDYLDYMPIQREFFYSALNSCVKEGLYTPGVSFIPDWHKL